MEAVEGASSSVRPALAMVGSLLTGYSEISTAVDSLDGSVEVSRPRRGGAYASEAAFTSAYVVVSISPVTLAVFSFEPWITLIIVATAVSSPV
jgi:hypothetical protein